LDTKIEIKMPQVKFNNEKWWVFHQEVWKEIDTKYWRKLMSLISEISWGEKGMEIINWQPVANHIYELPDEIQFDIKMVCIACCSDETGIDCPVSVTSCKWTKESDGKQVAHLKDSELKKLTIEEAMLKNTNVNLDFDNDESLLEEIQDYLLSLGQNTSLHEIDVVVTFLKERSEEVDKEIVKSQDDIWNDVAYFVNNEPEEYISDNTILELQKLYHVWELKSKSIGFVSKDSQSEIESLKSIIHGAEIEMQRVKEDEIPFLKERIKELESKLAERDKDVDKLSRGLLANVKKHLNDGKLSPKEEEQ